jgi:hypothetical protein
LRQGGTARGEFVAENLVDLEKQGVLATGVPAELGGGDASYPDPCEMLRFMARRLSEELFCASPIALWRPPGVQHSAAL